MPTGDASSSLPRAPVALLPQLSPAGFSGLVAGGGALPGGGVAPSTLAIVNGVPVMLDLAKLVELMQMGASLSMVQPTADMVNNAAAAAAASAWPSMGAQAAAPPAAKHSDTRQLHDADDVESDEGQYSPSMMAAGGERGPIESVWSKRISELTAFRESFGHADVKRGGDRWESLARWLDNLRKKWARREGYVPPDKALVLRQLGIEPYQERDDRAGEVHRSVP
jgi:hypothetical protein